MSSIQWSGKKRVIWTDINSIGLNDEWVADLVADGYEFIDRRTPPKKLREGEIDGK